MFTIIKWIMASIAMSNNPVSWKQLMIIDKIDNDANFIYHEPYTMILPWYYHGITMVLPWYYHGITMVLPLYYHDITMILP